MTLGRTVLAMIGLLIVAVVIIVVASRADACDGFATVDGCVTIDRYNDLYSLDNLEQTESLAFRGRSVAEVYDLGVYADSLPVDRPREFMGQPEPTIRELIHRIVTWRGKVR